MKIGGVGEIGMNLEMYGFGNEDKREWMVVDMGVRFEGKEKKGEEIIMKDIRYIEDEKKNMRGIVIKNENEDNFGEMIDIWKRMKVKVYEKKLIDGMMEEKRKQEESEKEIKIKIYKEGEKFEVGKLKIEEVDVKNQIKEKVQMEIKKKIGKVVNKGEWKMDKEKQIGKVIEEERFREIGEEGVMEMI